MNVKVSDQFRLKNWDYIKASSRNNNKTSDNVIQSLPSRLGSDSSPGGKLSSVLLVLRMCNVVREFRAATNLRKNNNFSPLYIIGNMNILT